MDIFAYDTHAHLDDEAFSGERDKVIEKIRKSGVGLVNNIGSDIESSKTSVYLAEKYDFIYAAVGVHPSETTDMTEEDILTLKALAANKKTVAIGEIGLDYHYEDTNRELQKKWFERQLDLAADLNMPVIIHDRDSKGECIEILRRKGVRRGVIHCFSGSRETALEILKMGLHISFTGVITFKNARRAREALEVIPMDRLFIETDCPYMAPEPHRGERNDSSLVIYVAQRIAELKGITTDEVIKATTENAVKFFGIE